jgi:hypothetical protein
MNIHAYPPPLSAKPPKGGSRRAARSARPAGRLVHGDGRITRLEAGDAATETGGARPEPLQATSAPPGPTAQRDQRHREREIRLCERLNVRFAPKADKRVDVSLSPLCQKPTLARSLDHLVRSHLHDQRDCDVENLGGLEIDDQLELHRLAHGYLSRLCAF